MAAERLLGPELITMAVSMWRVPICYLSLAAITLSSDNLWRKPGANDGVGCSIYKRIAAADIDAYGLLRKASQRISDDHAVNPAAIVRRSSRRVSRESKYHMEAGDCSLQTLKFISIEDVIP